MAPKSGLFAGKRPWGSAIHALWGPEWTRLPFFPATQEVLPQRGHALRPTIRRRFARGPRCGSWPRRDVDGGSQALYKRIAVRTTSLAAARNDGAQKGAQLCASTQFGLDCLVTTGRVRAHPTGTTGNPSVVSGQPRPV